MVPGFTWRCSPIQSILHSNLKCLYSDNNCLNDLLLYYINFSATAVPIPPLDPTTLIRTTTNSTVRELADNLFVEQWNSSLSYERYFDSCQPRECQYIYSKRANYVYVFTIFLAIYGGLTLSLRLLVPFVMKYLLGYRRPGHQRFRDRIRELNQVDEHIRRINLFRNSDVMCGKSSGVHWSSAQNDLYLCDSMERFQKPSVWYS